MLQGVQFGIDDQGSKLPSEGRLAMPEMPHELDVSVNLAFAALFPAHFAVREATGTAKSFECLGGTGHAIRWEKDRAHGDVPLVEATLVRKDIPRFTRRAAHGTAHTCDKDNCV
jgi:hypothetical protein